MASLLDEKNNIKVSYNLYFETNKGISLYNKRFKIRKYSFYEAYLITKICKKIILQKSKDPEFKKFSILDFGCGEGRLEKLYEKLAKFCKNLDVELEIIAYDISKIGINCYINKLLDKGFKRSAQKPDILLKDNQIYHFTNECPIEKSQLNQEIKVNVVLSIFGVLCHVPTQNARIELLKKLSAIAMDKIIISVALFGNFKEELQYYKSLRNNQGDEIQSSSGSSDLGMAIEEGDLYYVKRDEYKSFKLFYHLYTLNSLKNELSKAYVKIDSINLCNYLHPSISCKNYFYFIYDALICSVMLKLPFLLNKCYNKGSYVMMSGQNFSENS